MSRLKPDSPISELRCTTQDGFDRKLHPVSCETSQKEKKITKPMNQDNNSKNNKNKTTKKS